MYVCMYIYTQPTIYIYIHIHIYIYIYIYITHIHIYIIMEQKEEIINLKNRLEVLEIGK